MKRAWWWAVGGIVLFLVLKRDKVKEAGMGLARRAITVDRLRAAMPNIPLSRAVLYAGPLADAMDWAEITTPSRMAAFLAQIGHESADLRYMEEIWGPTDAQRRYEPPSDLAARLGNTQPGDGYRFRGRGPIQLTGRANYRAFGQAVGEDTEGNPDLVSRADLGFKAAAWYWKARNLNALADRRDFDGITRAINGGLNGKADRDARHLKAQTAFSLV